MVKSLSIIAGVLIILGITVSGVGIFIPGFINSQVTSGVIDALVLKDDNLEDFFKAPDLEEDTPTYLSFHLYNISNGDAVMAAVLRNYGRGESS